jgi:hypothetical protein
MIRDKGPIHGLGYGLTSRDVPFNENETEGISPNSGLVTRALDGNPVMRFFAATAATVAVAGVLNANLKKGGLKLAQKLQSAATNKPSGSATSLISGITDIRRHLDELQGVKRYIDGVDDPYSKLVFETPEGTLTTGYSGSTSERFRYGYITKQEIQQAGRGIDKEPPAVWTFRDEIQKRMVRATRRLPYELPSLYVTQKTLTDPLFGANEENKKKVKWYNPADVISDFVKTSLANTATMVMPFELGGAGIAKTKSSLHTFKYSMSALRDMSPGQQAVAKGFVNLNDILGEVGNSFAGVTSGLLKKSSQMSRSPQRRSKKFH